MEVLLAVHRSLLPGDAQHVPNAVLGALGVNALLPIVLTALGYKVQKRRTRYGRTAGVECEPCIACHGGLLSTSDKGSAPEPRGTRR